MFNILSQADLKTIHYGQYKLLQIVLLMGMTYITRNLEANSGKHNFRRGKGFKKRSTSQSNFIRVANRRQRDYNEKLNGFLG